MIVPDLQALAEPIEILVPMPNNPRRGNIEAVIKSLEQFGQRKPIVVRRRDSVVLSGNHTLAAASALGWTEIAVVWTDDDEATGSAWALADNRTSDLGTYDDEALAELIEQVAAADNAALFAATSYDESDLEELRAAINNLDDLDGYAATDEADEDIGNLYTTKIGTPVYEIVGDQPAISDLFMRDKERELLEEIKSADIPKDVKQFLTVAASRHIVYDFRKIAEFYPHQTPDVQRLMERSALVIIDFDDAIKNGFVKLSTRLDALVREAREHHATS